MYQIGQQVLYGAHGVCSVAAVQAMRFGRTTEDYYVLHPVGQTDSRYYIPVANEAALAKLRPLLTRQELMELLHSDQVRQDVWVSDENQRKLRFREILSRGDRAEILSMICCLHRHRQAQQRLGRKFHQSDESFLKDAEKLMNAEFSHVLGIQPGQVGQFILSQMDLEHETPV